MGKKFVLFFFLIIFCGLFGLAQTDAIDPLIQKYQAIEKSDRAPKYYLLQLETTSPQSLKNLVSINAQRKLSDSVYIIDTILLNKISRLNPNIKKILVANNYWKLSTGVTGERGLKNKKDTLSHFQILFKDIKTADRILWENPGLNQNNISILRGQKILSLVCNIQQVENVFLKEDDVIFIDLVQGVPKEELGTPGYDLSANKINLVHSQYPSITGLGQHVSIKEDFYDTTDIDIKGRYELSPLASGNVTNHANFMATIIAGAGNSAFYAKGAAYDAMISSSSFGQILPDADNSYLQNKISLQNHSYGTVIENNYGLSAMAFDKSANNNEALLHVFSSGNIGTGTSNIGTYAGVAGFANLTGNFKMAKNIITVGAVDSFGNVAPLSSRGPAYDGRIKPELVAFQHNGTSEAAALVSGTTLLLQQYYNKLHLAGTLSSALAKAILINSADDVGAPGPDFKTGFGNLNAIKAMDIVRDNKIFTGNINEGATQTFSINLPSNISLLKVTLVWNDTAASPLASKALINDLDLEVVIPNSNFSWKPWVLNSFANIDSLNNFAVRKKDNLNNVEQVTISSPPSGAYVIKINGYNLPTGSQKYHVVYSWDSLNDFHWQRPAKIDFIEAGSRSVLRWQNASNGNGSIELSFVSSNYWQPVVSNIALQQNYIYWNVPDTIAQANLRMKIGNEYFYSDTFLITTLLKPTTGFICGDTMLIYWPKLKNIGRYQLYQLGTKFMEPLLSVTDTIAVISIKSLSEKYLAVAPVMNNGMIPQKSYGFNYTAQGSGCVIDAFYADKQGDIAKLTLSLGTRINVAAISFEKLTASGYTTIQTPTLTNQLQYVFEYGPLVQGITSFRAKVVLVNGQVLYTKPEAVFYAAPGKYVLFPIPVLRNNDITLITTIPAGETISLFDVLGRVVLKQDIQSSRESIQTAHLQAGQYFYIISKNGIKVTTGKLIVL